MPVHDSTPLAVSVASAQSESALAIWSQEERDIIRSVIAHDLTNAELAFFAQVCRATGLNPLMNQIVPIKRNDSKAPGGKKLTIQTTIHGLRLIADRTKDYAPGRRPVFEYGPADSKGKPTIISATACVKKFAGGMWHEVEDTAYWDEYVQTYGNGGAPVALWATKPHVMLAKCAEALALRRAFPAEMAGIYTDDEYPLPDSKPIAAEVVDEEPRQQRQVAAPAPPAPPAPRQPETVIEAAPVDPMDRKLGVKMRGQWMTRAQQSYSKADEVAQIARDLTGVEWTEMSIRQAEVVTNAMESTLLARDLNGRYIIAEPVWDEAPAEAEAVGE